MSGGRSSPYGGLPPGGGDGGSSENVLNKIVTPLRWGIGGLTKTVRSRFHPPRGRRSKKKSREEDSSAHHASLPAQVRGFLGSPNAENEAGPSAAMPSAAPVASEVRRRSDSARHSPRRAPHPSLFNPKRRRSTSRLFCPEDADATPNLTRRSPRDSFRRAARSGGASCDPGRTQHGELAGRAEAAQQPDERRDAGGDQSAAAPRPRL